MRILSVILISIATILVSCKTEQGHVEPRGGQPPPEVYIEEPAIDSVRIETEEAVARIESFFGKKAREESYNGQK